MKKALQLFLFVGLMTISCKPIDYDNQYDPASDNYSPPVSRIIMVDDFDDGDDINLWGHKFTGYNDTRENGIITTSLSLDNQQPKLSGKGYVLKLSYDVTTNSRNVGWGQFLNDFESGTFFSPQVLGVKTFSFWIRGEKGGEQFYIGFSDASEIASFVAVTEVTTNWQKVPIALDSFKKQGFNISKLFFFHLNFYTGIMPPTGTIYLDNFAFEY